MADTKDMQTYEIELNELKTRLSVAEEQLREHEELPTVEKTENMIKEALDQVPDYDRVKIIIQDTIYEEQYVRKDFVEKKIARLKLWLYASVVGIATTFISTFLL
ncbi:hypothetical protein [Desertibacillus haloalkaliphilus]|uniref:hypothetical protein n=1 Tax=Desertibacillus haloalkaliphilus TaxID=1328930 RepID=UPI001C27DABD|nr:hypothetical protein [Desertibacillus haloalkaliphilus]MBU8905557.1 hypothetical protein [Desertibacillus haloalkaliphilus]